MFSDPKHVAGELAEILPPELAAQIDWSTLRLATGSYVDADLSRLIPDFEHRLDDLQHAPKIELIRRSSHPISLTASHLRITYENGPSQK